MINDFLYNKEESKYIDRYVSNHSAILNESNYKNIKDKIILLDRSYIDLVGELSDYCKIFSITDLSNFIKYNSDRYINFNIKFSRDKNKYECNITNILYNEPINAKSESSILGNALLSAFIKANKEDDVAYYCYDLDLKELEQ